MPPRIPIETIFPESSPSFRIEFDIINIKAGNGLTKEFEEGFPSPAQLAYGELDTKWKKGLFAKVQSEHSTAFILFSCADKKAPSVDLTKRRDELDIQSPCLVLTENPETNRLNKVELSTEQGLYTVKVSDLGGLEELTLTPWKWCKKYKSLSREAIPLEIGEELDSLLDMFTIKKGIGEITFNSQEADTWYRAFFNLLTSLKPYKRQTLVSQFQY
ncbi:hypothetical protein M0R04_02885 [Candidatus Dojkabacteria bacterium]|jgi:hypothetical protein|nr:hypothetical protein [Candidatus Dojkabacteria bacterium]